jgi:hypothetical protein
MRVTTYRIRYGVVPGDWRQSDRGSTKNEPIVLPGPAPIPGVWPGSTIGSCDS